MPRKLHAAAKEPEFIKLTGEVEIVAASADQKGPRQFKVKAYTGGELRVTGYGLPVVIDLAGMTAARSIVANLHHQRTAIVGHVTETTNDGRQLDLGGKVSGTGAAAQEFLANHDNEFPWQASVEVLPSKVVEIGEGRKAQANGREFVGPILIARKSKLHGVAFVDRGADQDTYVTVAASAASKEIDMDFEKWIEALGFDADNPPNDKQKAMLRAKYDAEIKASKSQAGKQAADDKDEAEIKAPAFDLDEVKAVADDHLVNLEAIFAEREDAVSQSKQRKFAEVKAQARKDARELKAKAIKERWAATRLEIESLKLANKAQLAVIECTAPDGPAIHSSHKDVNGEVIEAALCMTLGVKNIEKQYKEQTLEAAHDPYMRNMTLHQLLITAAACNGYHARPGERITDTNIRTVLEHAFGRSIHASGFSTVSLSTILGNVANKMILEGYMDVEQNWREIAAVKNVTNFYQRTHVRMLDNMEFEEVGSGGEIKHGKLSQETYTSQAKTYAIMLGLTRTQIINDDLGAFNDLRDRIGRGGARKFNNKFWTTFIDNSSFFTSARTNYIEGSTTNLGTDGVGLGLGVKAFRTMRTPEADGSKRLGGNPVKLLVPPELETVAEQLYAARNVAQVKVSDANIFAGKYKPVIEARLSDSSFTGNSTTAWYLFRNTAELAPMVVSFLNGMQSPTVESADADFNVLGVQFRGYFDFGCDQAEYLAGVKSKGAA